jgi:hypothetical protein
MNHTSTPVEVSKSSNDVHAASPATDPATSTIGDDSVR